MSDVRYCTKVDFLETLGYIAENELDDCSLLVLFIATHVELRNNYPRLVFSDEKTVSLKELSEIVSVPMPGKPVV